MKNICSSFVLSLFLIFLSGCGAKTLDDAIEHGAKKLSHADLFELLSGSTVEAKGYGSVAKITYNADGKLNASNNAGDTDKGVWEITDADQLCIQFNKWGEKDRLCYHVYEAGTTYKQFNSKGMQIYTFTILEKGSGAIIEGISFTNQSIPVTSKTQINRAVNGQSSAPQYQMNTELSPRAASDIEYIFRETARDCPGCNFAGRDFSGVDLMGANLEGANMSGTDLSKALLKRANLKGANFYKANLQGANLKGADLTGANFSGADLTDAQLEGAIGFRER